MKSMNVLLLIALIAGASAAEEKKDKPEEVKADDKTNKDKRGLFDFGYGGHDFVDHSEEVFDFHHSPPKVITKTVHVPQPYPVHIDRPVPVPVKVPVDRPVPVEVPKPYPVTVEKFIPYKVDKPVPYPVKVPVKVPVIHKVEVPVPKPYPVFVEKHVPVFIKEKDSSSELFHEFKHKFSEHDFLDSSEHGLFEPHEITEFKKHVEPLPKIVHH